MDEMKMRSWVMLVVSALMVLHTPHSVYSEPKAQKMGSSKIKREGLDKTFRDGSFTQYFSLMWLFIKCRQLVIIHELEEDNNTHIM